MMRAKNSGGPLKSRKPLTNKLAKPGMQHVNPAQIRLRLRSALDAAGAALAERVRAQIARTAPKETDATYGDAREKYELANRTLSSARWKSERVMDASINRILGHIGVKMGYAYELKRIEEQA